MDDQTIPPVRPPSEIVEEGVTVENFDTQVIEMLRAVCKDEHVDVVEAFIKQFQEIDWDEALTSDTQYQRARYFYG